MQYRLLRNVSWYAEFGAKSYVKCQTSQTSISNLANFFGKLTNGLEPFLSRFGQAAMSIGIVRKNGGKEEVDCSLFHDHIFMIENVALVFDQAFYK
jgi:hypothetical protein